MQNPFCKIFRFYRDGFAGMQLGRTLWLIILLKLFILFLIIKPVFFPDILQTRFQSNDERAAFVFRQLSEAASAARSTATVKPSTVEVPPSEVKRDAITR